MVEVLKAGEILEQSKAIKKIHINQHNIRSNKKDGTELPVVTIKVGRKNYYCNSIEIMGPSKLSYCGSGDKDPILSCGARVVLETNSIVRITG